MLRSSEIKPLFVDLSLCDKSFFFTIFYRGSTIIGTRRLRHTSFSFATILPPESKRLRRQIIRSKNKVSRRQILRRQIIRSNNKIPRRQIIRSNYPIDIATSNNSVSQCCRYTGKCLFSLKLFTARNVQCP